MFGWGLLGTKFLAQQIDLARTDWNLSHRDVDSVDRYDVWVDQKLVFQGFPIMGGMPIYKLQLFYAKKSHKGSLAFWLL